MASSEAMTSSTHSFAYSYRCFQKCFVKICETSKCHNFLIFQPIFIKFSLFCLKMFTLSSEIKLNLFRISPLMSYEILYKLLFSRGFYFREFREPDPRENFHFNSCLFIVMTTSEKSRN